MGTKITEIAGAHAPAGDRCCSGGARRPRLARAAHRAPYWGVSRIGYAPATINGWLAILRVTMKAAKRKFALLHLATEGVENFDASEHGTYTEEEPNALLPEEVPRFLEALRDLHPQHYAMAFLGLATGLRPSSLRPLRRSGPTADILWDKSALLVRRSQTMGDEVMNTTKQRVRYTVHLPSEVLDLLRWHVKTQLTTPQQEDSELLFPGVTGGFRSPTVLNKPFADVVDAIGLGKQFTQRGLRRTFNDLARAAEVEALGTRSISGHLTEQMQHHYSTVNPTEQRASIAKVIHLFGAEAGGKTPRAGGEDGGEDRHSGGEDGGEDRHSGGEDGGEEPRSGGEDPRAGGGDLRAGGEARRKPSRDGGRLPMPAKSPSGEGFRGPRAGGEDRLPGGEDKKKAG